MSAQEVYKTTEPSAELATMSVDALHLLATVAGVKTEDQFDDLLSEVCSAIETINPEARFEEQAITEARNKTLRKFGHSAVDQGVSLHVVADEAPKAHNGKWRVPC